MTIEVWKRRMLGVWIVNKFLSRITQMSGKIYTTAYTNGTFATPPLLHKITHLYSTAIHTFDTQITPVTRISAIPLTQVQFTPLSLSITSIGMGLN